MSGPLTANRFKAYAKIPGETEDSVLQPIVDSLNSWVEAYTDKEFLRQQVFREAYDGTGGTKLWLRRTPIVEVHVVEYGIPPNLTVLSSGLYSFYATAIFTDGLGDSKFQAGTRNWHITYTGGYEQDRMPERLIWALCEMGLLMKKDQDGRLGITSEGLGAEISTTFTRELSKPARQAIDSFKRIII